MDGRRQYASVRSPLIKLLSSGRVRRKLIVPASSAAHTDTESALRMLLLSSLQIEPDLSAPWSLPPEELKPIAAQPPPIFAAARSTSSLHTHAFRAEALVGKRIEIWWDGDALFHTALVIAYKPDGGFDGRIPPRTHLVRYEADGLQAVEDLDGKGEPNLWRICGGEEEEEAAAETVAEEKVAVGGQEEEAAGEEVEPAEQQEEVKAEPPSQEPTHSTQEPTHSAPG